MAKALPARAEVPYHAASAGRHTRPMTAPRQSNDLGQTAAILLWVGIAAGLVFIVALVFFSGFFIGRHSGSGFSFDGDRDGVPGMMWPQRNGPYGPMGPGMMGPNGSWGPSQQPSASTAPSPSPSR